MSVSTEPEKWMKTHNVQDLMTNETMKDEINLIFGKNLLCTNNSFHVAELHREKVKASFQHHCCPSIAPRVKKR